MVRLEPAASTVSGVTSYITQVLTADSTAGNSAANPIFLPVRLNLAGTGWTDLLSAIQTAGKYVALDLSACTMTGITPAGEFDPGAANTGEGKIVSLVLPDTAKSVKAGTNSNPTFKNFTALTSVAAAGVQTVGNYAFAFCTALETLSLPAAVTIGEYAFYDTSLSTLSLPAAKTIGGDAFSFCAALETVSLPAAASINSYAFSNCTALETLSFPAVTDIGEQAFVGCTGFSTLNLPVATSIGDGAFIGCTGLETVSLPAVASIGDVAFVGCTALSTLSFPAAKTIGGGAFEDCIALETVSLPASLTSVGNPFAGCIKLDSIAVAAGNPAYKHSADGKMILSKDGKTLIAYPSASGTVTLDGITSVGGDLAFYKCTALTTLNLPAAASIGTRAFAWTGTAALTLTLGSTPPTLGTNMFNGVDSAKNVTVKVPSGATGYGTPGTYTGADAADNWGNAFRGKGWDGSGCLTGTLNSNISLTIETVP
jgi:hypothetical protein